VGALSAEIEGKILWVRGMKVLLDRDLAVLYGTTTKALNQAVRRNLSRFPDDFMPRLTPAEVVGTQEDGSRSRIVTLKRGGNVKYAPLAFTEQGGAMLSSVLRSGRAIQVNIAIMRVFVRLRELVASHRALARRIDELEKRYDSQFRVVFDAIRELMKQEEPPSRIGFKP
jgi:hypothetical protein